MSDWEDDMDGEEESKGKDEVKNEEKKVEQGVKKGKFEDESEDIKVIQKEVVKTINPKEKAVDYEEIYNKRHQESIKKDKEIQESIKGIKDEELRQKKLEELQILKRAEEFMSDKNGEKEKAGKEDSWNSLSLNVEKDYITLAQKIAALINNAKKQPSFTLSFIQNCIELLGPTLENSQIQKIIDSCNIIYNKKLKEDGIGVKKKGGKKNKPSLKGGKAQERNVNIDDTYDNDDEGYDEYEDEEYEDNFM